MFDDLDPRAPSSDKARNAGDLEKALWEARREVALRERLMAILGHDLRDPLSVISLGIAALLSQQALAERERAVLTRIQISTARMEAMIRDLLVVAPTQCGGLGLARRTVDLGLLAGRAIEQVEAVFSAQEFRLEVSGACTGQWDPERLHQAVANLLRNAACHGDAQRPVAVKVRGEADRVALEVHNWGPPISAGELGEVFAPFRRASGGGGLGLGLYIVREIVLAHGGKVEVRSSAERGTCFTVWLPRPPPTSGPSA